MRKLAMMFLIGAVMVGPNVSLADISTIAKTDSLVFSLVLDHTRDVDPSAQSLRFFFTGGSSLRVDMDKIDRIVDETETPHRVFAEVTFYATSTLPEELEKFKTWKFDRARQGFYRPMAGAKSIRPDVKIVLVFPNNAEENRYVMSFVRPESHLVMYRPSW